MPRLTNVERARLVGLLQGGMSVDDVADQMNCSIPTVQRWQRAWEDGGRLDDLPRNPKNRATTEDEDMIIVGIAVANPMANAATIKGDLQLNVSGQTIRNRLHEAGLHSRVAARKDILKPRHVAERLLFAQNHQNWDEEWDGVLFTDESCVQSSPNGKIRVWRPAGRRYDDGYVQVTKNSGRFSVSVWSCCSLQGLGRIHRIEGRLEHRQYLDLLEHVAIPEILHIHFADGFLWLMQDKSPIHQARAVRTWFDNHPELRLLPWPSKGADMNPIENVWAKLKAEIAPKLTNVHNADDLWNAIEETWEIIRQDADYIHALIDSMPRRIQAVIDNNGGWTKY